MSASTLANLITSGRTAVVVQEMQSGVLGPDSALPALVAAAAEVGVVDNAATVAAAARAAAVPVIHATAQNLPDNFGANRNARLFATVRKADTRVETVFSQPISSVFAEGDLVLPRYHGLSPMADGQLDALLRNAGITSLVIVGVSLNIGIPNLVFDAVNRSYEVVVVADAVVGVPVGYGREVLAHTLGLVATMSTTDQVVAVWSGYATPA